VTYTLATEGGASLRGSGWRLVAQVRPDSWAREKRERRWQPIYGQQKLRWEKRSMISINAIRERKGPFKINDWIMDSGAFTEMSTYGRWRTGPEEYAEQINRWKHNGNLLAAVSQALMCEPFILEKSGLTIQDHQTITIERYLRLIELTNVSVMPVLQGYSPDSYAAHVRQYGGLLKHGQWVGVGSVCKRNGNPDQIEDVLLAIKAHRPDLRLHGFGLKMEALKSGTVRALLHSSDSMAWSFAGRILFARRTWKKSAKKRDSRIGILSRLRARTHNADRS